MPIIVTEKRSLLHAAGSTKRRWNWRKWIGLFHPCSKEDSRWPISLPNTSKRYPAPGEHYTTISSRARFPQPILTSQERCAISLARLASRRFIPFRPTARAEPIRISKGIWRKIQMSVSSKWTRWKEPEEGPYCLRCCFAPLGSWGVSPRVCKWIISGGQDHTKTAFTRAQDRATLENDPSVARGLAGRRGGTRRLLAAPENQSGKLRGGGAAPRITQSGGCPDGRGRTSSAVPL